MKIPKYKFRYEADPLAIASMSIEAQSLFEELSRPSETEVVPGLQPIPNVADYLLAELMVAEAVVVDSQAGLLLVINQVFKRPPKSPNEVREWVRKIQTCPKSDIRLTTIHLVFGACISADISHRPLSDTLRLALAGELEQVEERSERWMAEAAAVRSSRSGGA